MSLVGICFCGHHRIKGITGVHEDNCNAMFGMSEKGKELKMLNGFWDGKEKRVEKL